MRTLSTTELDAIQGSGVYWVPDVIVTECDLFGCYDVYYPGYYQQVEDDVNVAAVISAMTSIILVSALAIWLVK